MDQVGVGVSNFTKRCTKCLCTKTSEEFTKRAGGKTRSMCKQCCNAYAKKRYEDPEYRRRRIETSTRSRLRTKYGLTTVGYDSLLIDQGGVCAICASLPPVDRRLAVDHDHITGAVRGLLCTRCNKTLGLFHDDREIIIRASNYLLSPPHKKRFYSQ